MTITRKQEDEIFFLSKKLDNYEPSIEEKTEFIEYVVSGTYPKRDNRGNVINRLFNSKRGFEISSKLWKQDILQGLLFINEMDNDFDCEYWKRIRPQFHALQVEYFTKNKDKFIKMATNMKKKLDKE